MSRLVWPLAFQLYGAALTDPRQIERGREVRKKFFTPRKGDSNPYTDKSGLADAVARPPDQFGDIPVALRWFTVPSLGFPRAPFQVWSRPRDYKPKTQLFNQPLVINGGHKSYWGFGEMYEVSFQATPAAGQTMVVDALDSRGKPIPEQRITFTAPRLGLFRSPGIVGLKVQGNGTIQTVLGFAQDELANLPGWRRIETVGLPYKKSEAALPEYAPDPQGLEPPAMDGLTAALRRLGISQLLSLPIPPTGMATVPAPPWDPPDPALYLKVLRKSSPFPGPFRLIRRCLANTVDSNPAKLQADFLVTEAIPGIQQSGVTGAPTGDPADTSVPVVGVTMLALSTDNDASVGLGYGTLDFPFGLRPIPAGDHQLPPRLSLSNIDYMVTAIFVTPFFRKLELAALMQPLGAPQTAQNLSSAVFNQNRASALDQDSSEAVQLSWDFPSHAQGYGVLVKHGTVAPGYLNAARAFHAGGYDPYVAQQPASVNGDVPAGVRATFMDSVAPVPVAGSILSRYLLIVRDLFGRWSGWAQTTHTAIAPPVTAPGLTSAALEFGDPVITVGPHVAKASCVIEFSWDWSDRTPDRIEFYGRFFPFDALTNPVPGFTGGFQLSTSSAPGAAVVVKFPGGNPTIVSSHTGTVVQLDPLSADNPRKYRLEIDGITCDFTSVPQVALSVTARGAEAVRPTALSAVMGPRVARANNPLPTLPPALPIDLKWTALPDAANKARGTLTWPPIAGAEGYIVWEATEEALRFAVDDTLPQHDPAEPLLARAGTLRSLVTGGPVAQARSLRAFTRLNDRPLADTSLDLTLPGAADTLFAYRVSTITKTGMESGRSDTIALFAVPRRNQPGQPRLLLRLVKLPVPGIEVIVIPGPGKPAAGTRVHRVRNAALGGDIGLMGPPKILPNDPNWYDTDVISLDGTVDHARAIFDPVTPSWHAYQYRVVAVGREDLVNGEFAGESLPSALQSLLLPPSGPPLLDAVHELAVNPTNRVIGFGTNLPVKGSPAGPALIQIIEQVPGPSTMQRNVVLSVRANEVNAGPPLSLIGSPSTSELSAMPEISRDNPDSAGRASYTVRLQTNTNAVALLVAVTDPLKRTIEREIGA